jgi:hypothetical protein
MGSLELEGDEEPVEEGGPLAEEGSTEMGDGRPLNFVGATIRDGSYPGDGGEGAAGRAGARRLDARGQRPRLERARERPPPR